MKEIDLSPGRKSITARYGVPPPRQALGIILARYVSAETVAAILQALGAEEARYQRAVKVEQIRRRRQAYAAREALDLGRPVTRSDKALIRDQAILDHAAGYIEGTWRP